MKTYFLVAILVGLSLLVGSILRGKPESSVSAQETGAPSARSAVVVELFTSEGCSSCPPADALLLKLQEQQPVGNAEILALEEHVDYWDNGGWVDPFSSAAATERQTSYAVALGNGNTYTPQMIVDGQTEFVGSREGQARGAIGEAARGNKLEVTVTSVERAADETEVFGVKVGDVSAFDVRHAPEVWLAITESGLHSNVRGGENSGEDLHHAAVVRRLNKIGTVKPAAAGGDSFSSEERVKLNGGWKRENLRAVVFVQEPGSKKILGAASVQLPTKSFGGR
jgi:hypothetical protein